MTKLPKLIGIAIIACLCLYYWQQREPVTTARAAPPINSTVAGIGITGRPPQQDLVDITDPSGNVTHCDNGDCKHVRSATRHRKLAQVCGQMYNAVSQKEEYRCIGVQGR